MSDTAEERLAAGDPHGALAALQEHVRARPADAGARVFLFQLLCILGEWGRAGNQLDVAAELDSTAKLMAQTYRELLRCEVFRKAVFDGHRVPMVLGEPPAWLAPLIQALPLAAVGDGEAAARLANDAFDRAAERAGRFGGATITDGGADEHAGEAPDEIAFDGSVFDWIGDADMRLGPVLEAMIDGKYYWVPFEHIGQLVIEPPSDLRDLVWTPAEFHWNGGGRSVGFVPTRYPANSTHATDVAESSTHLMARRSDWIDLGGDYFIGLGQRMLVSSAGDHPLLECRALRFDDAASEVAR